MSYWFRLTTLCLLLLPLPWCFAEDEPAIPGSELTIHSSDGADLTLHQYPAAGDFLVIWIASGYGLSSRDIQLAEGLAHQGVEVWQIDFAQALFQVGGSNYMRNLNPQYVVELINAAQQRTRKKVVLLSHSYGAIPALRGATLWQLQRTRDGRLSGVILLSPDFYASIPELGLEPKYLPITRSSTIPLMIFQAGKRGNRGQFPRLLKQLTQSNDSVFFKVLAGVTSPLYQGDTSEATLHALRSLPRELVGAVHLLDSVPAAARLPDYRFQPEREARLDSRLKPYRATPQPSIISLTGIDNQHHHIDDFAGKVSIINFWASWCTPCVEEIPSLNRLRRKMQGKPFQLISVNYAESPATIQAFLKQVRVEYPVLLDSNGEVSAQWRVIAYPSTFVIGSDGLIHYGVNAAIAWDAPEVVRLIEGLMPK